MPFATSADILAVVASHLDSVHQMAMLCGVNKTTSAYLLWNAGLHWARIGKSVCGHALGNSSGTHDQMRAIWATDSGKLSINISTQTKCIFHV